MTRIMKALKAKLMVKNHFYYLVMVFVSYSIGNYFSRIDSNENQRIAITGNEAFSEKALLDLMKRLKIKYPETVLSQARLETGNFTSDIFKENHNLFGMKVAEKRPTLAIGLHRGHAQYRDWKDSVVDYALFQSYIIAKLPKNNIEEYRNYIQKFYSETSDYLTRIDRTVEFDKSKLAFNY